MGSQSDTPPTNASSAVVFGDIVLDTHVYGGVKTSATAFAEPGTVVTTRLGGAELTRKLLKAAADAKGAAWDDVEMKWRDEIKAKAEENARRAAETDPSKKWPPLSIPARPDDHPEFRPNQAFSVHAGLETADLKESLPSNLQSYGVWTSHPSGVKDKGPVWRVQKHFGYGPAPKPGESRDPIYTRAGNPPANPSLVLIDDGGIHYRHQASNNAWPDFSSTGSSLFLLKMSAPLCRGDLWPALVEKCADRLIVVVSAEDLRGEDAQIRRRLSWEQCATDALRALHEAPIIRDLLEAAHVIVNFRSAGALWLHRPEAKTKHTARLIYDPAMIEGDFKAAFDGTVYGFQTCLAAAVAHHFVAGLTEEKPARLAAIERGIVSGLTARRSLLTLGHGPAEPGKEPGFPVKEIGAVIAATHGGFHSADVPAPDVSASGCQWTILASSETSAPVGSAVPPPALVSLALLTARYGRNALSTYPCYCLDKIFTVDRSEIESLRILDRLIRTYKAGEVQEKPLSIGVFGPPGAGKSFAVKALSRAIFGEKVPIIEFNLSQFKDPAELIGAFHRIRDAVLKGITPVAFWDEFDSRGYEWLQYLLAPMQDGAFQEGQVTHPIGKCVFIFAGGTADRSENFGVNEPAEMSPAERRKFPGYEYTERREDEKAWHDFKLLKGPDFISRLHGHLDVLGPNPRKNEQHNNPPGQPAAHPACPDLTWPIRRALMLRGILGLKDDPKNADVLDMDPGLLYALLSVPQYRHGSRSFEKILLTLANDRDRTGPRFQRSSLPPDPLLDRETDATAFHNIMNQRNTFKTHADIEALAAAVHQSFLSAAAKAGLDAQIASNPQQAWIIHPAVKQAYDTLTDDLKASNRAAARRIPDHLALIDFVILPQTADDDDSWTAPLTAALEKHIERLAEAEHLGWMEERTAAGWTWAEKRDNTLKQHPSLVPWVRLSPQDKEKDRVNIRAISALLNVAGCKAVPV